MKQAESDPRARFNSDLATERRRADLALPGLSYKRTQVNIGEWERIRVSSPEAAESIGRPEGNYDTLNLPRLDTMDADALEDAVDEVARELCHICTEGKICPERILVAGLGNPALTPDAVGCEVLRHINPTLQISMTDGRMFDALECSEIALIAPGVSGTSGLDSADVIAGIADRICPDVIIAVDALAARSPKRLGTTLQICDTGIHPGSGVGSHKKAIDERMMGVPVIAIGVATVIDAMLSVGEDETECQEMLVCPKDIDGIVKNAAKIIAGGINQAFGVMY